jgi:uncharacterized membrane protein
VQELFYLLVSLFVVYNIRKSQRKIMQNLKLFHKIILVNIAVALFFGIVFTIAEGTGTLEDFALSFGVACLLGGLLDLLIGLFCLLQIRNNGGKASC